MGRPPKSDKFDAQIAFQCHQWLKDAVEAYRAGHGLRSEGEALRLMVQKVTGAKAPKEKR